MRMRLRIIGKVCTGYHVCIDKPPGCPASPGHFLKVCEHGWLPGTHSAKTSSPSACYEFRKHGPSAFTLVNSLDRLSNGMQIGDWCPVGGIRGDGRPGTFFFWSSPSNSMLYLAPGLGTFRVKRFAAETPRSRIETRVDSQTRDPDWDPWRIRIFGGGIEALFHGPRA
jgi:hypothetical protein